MQQKTLGSCTANHALIDGILNIVDLSLKNCLVRRGTPHFSSTAGTLAHLLLLSSDSNRNISNNFKGEAAFLLQEKKTKRTEDGQFLICEHFQFTLLVLLWFL